MISFFINIGKRIANFIDEHIGFITMSIMIIIVAFMLFIFYRIDKHNCEKHNGIYIWEINSYGNKCHYKND